MTEKLKCAECGKVFRDGERPNTVNVDIHMNGYEHIQNCMFKLCDYCYHYWRIRLQEFTNELPSNKRMLKLDK